VPNQLPPPQIVTAIFLFLILLADAIVARGQPGSTSQTPRGPLMRTTVTTEIVGALNSPAPSVDPVIKVYRIPEPTDITVIDNAEKLYIVTKGEAVGIYDTW